MEFVGVEGEEFLGGGVAEEVVLLELGEEVGGEGVAGSYGVLDCDLSRWNVEEFGAIAVDVCAIGTLGDED